MMSNVLQYEETVFNLIQEYINQNRVLEIEKIIPYVSNRLSRASINLNYDGLKVILKSLIEKKRIAEGSKFTRQEILDNPKREIVFEFVRKNPGLYLNKICKALNLSRQVVAWHLEMLMRFGCVKQGSFDNHDIFFGATQTFLQAKKNYVLSKQKTKKILYYLNENDMGLTANQIAQSSSIHLNTVNKYLDFLEDFKIVFKVRDLSKIVYFINE